MCVVYFNQQRGAAHLEICFSMSFYFSPHLDKKKGKGKNEAKRYTKCQLRWYYLVFLYLLCNPTIPYINLYARNKQLKMFGLL